MAEETVADRGRKLSRSLIDTYFRTNPYPYTQHHIESYNHFLSQDVPSIIRANNPILILKDKIEGTDIYRYKVELYVGGLNGSEIEIGTPTLSLQNETSPRLLFPNEARLRGLTYAATVTANILVRITYTERQATAPIDISPANTTFQSVPLFTMPIMLHSNYCILHNKPKEFLREVGECVQDHGSYFIIDGAEKVLVTKQEQSFNTLYITPKDHDPRDPKSVLFASISCLSAKTRAVKRVTLRIWKDGQVLVGLPMVLNPIPLFTVFRALGFQSDEEILRLFYPDFETDEAKLFMPLLQPSMVGALPYMNTYTAIQYMKLLTKGKSDVTVIDILRNQMFIHMENDPLSQGLFLADCVKACLYVKEGYATKTDRDDAQNQRCLVSGFLIQMLFNNGYKKYVKAAKLAIDREWEFNKTTYMGTNFKDIFNTDRGYILFSQAPINEILMTGFKGKWDSGLGEENTGVIQALSRLSYCDFMSHCRRVILAFDTSSKLQGPRRLHGSQYGYYCTNETPSGASIGISKNMSILTAFSVDGKSEPLQKWLHDFAKVRTPNEIVEGLRAGYIPVYINGGLFGYTTKPQLLTRVLRAFKRTGCIPYSSSIVFSVRERRVKLYFDAGRPLRPLIAIRGAKIPLAALQQYKTWRDLVYGSLPATRAVSLSNIGFINPFEGRANFNYETCAEELEPSMGPLEYIDPYEQNESYIANFENNIVSETTHMEIHPSTILSFMTTVIPFCNHNQGVRNQLGDSQSKQGIGMYATNWQNRFDNTANVLCYGESHLVGTLYSNYMGEGKMPYGQNIVLAIAPSGYNQDDGFVFNKDALDRGLFRTLNYRSYKIHEEDDPLTNTKMRIGNPAKIPEWLSLRPGIDYSKLDDRGIIREGELCDENTVIVGGYSINEVGAIVDASLTPQVWTRGRVEKVVITVSNTQMRTVRVRIVQDRVPEIGDKFCLTEDHDVLTQNGWKSIRDITKEDSVCTLNEKEEIVYSNPTELYEFECANENLYHIQSQQIDLLTTLTHKMYIKKRDAKIFSLVEAKDIIGKRVQYKKDGMNVNPDYQCMLGTTKLNMDAFLEWFGYWISDGWVSLGTDYRIEVCLCLEKDRERFTELSSAMGYNVYSNTDRTKLFISNKQLATYLHTYSVGAIRKSLPKWVWDLSERQTRILLKGLIAGDGTVMKNGVERFYTSSVILSDQFQQLCLHAGWSANKKKIYDAGTKFIIKGKHTQANADYWGLTINKHKNNPMVNHGHVHQQKIQSEGLIPFTGKVYCIQVPSHIFYVRRNGKPVWTGNSNRHGQKGTIGIMLPGCDMPRTKDGIVPDMIMNMHAIPSRMTIAQNLEQLFGKTASLSGAIGDGTAFMNDGSPEGPIGVILEKMGFEKYGNEVLYDGTTGVQMPTSIFLGQVYEMRLKHMVEDKWQARGQGRKEQMTHQPTGGRGAQGGLKIGEMDRDAILAHSITGFYRESYMKRSDGATMSICTSCGTMPVYNPKMGIAICTLCDGPPKYVGNTLSNMYILPPMTKQKGRFVNVEIPYATKVLMQELSSIANVGMRFITTGDTQRLRPLEAKGTLTQEEAAAIVAKPLTPLEIVEPVDERLESNDEIEINSALLAELGAGASEVLLEEANAVATIALAKDEALKAADRAVVSTILDAVPYAEAAESAAAKAKQAAKLIRAAIGLNPTPAQLQSALDAEADTAMAANAAKRARDAATASDLPELLPPNSPPIVADKPSMYELDGGGMQQQQQQQQQPRSILRSSRLPANTVVYPPPFAGAPPTIGIQGTFIPPIPILSIDTSYDAMAQEGYSPMTMTTQPRARRTGPIEIPGAGPSQLPSGAMKFTVNKMG